MRTIQTGSLRLDDILVADVNLSDYLPLSGGTLTGNLSVKNADVSILSGRFSGGENATAIGKSAFAYGDSVSAIGDTSYAVGKDSIAGCYGWWYDHIDFENNTFYLTRNQPQVIHTSSLTGTGTIDATFSSGLEIGDIISYVNKKKFDLALSVVAVNGNQISVQPFKDKSMLSIAEIVPNHDDWSLFCPDKPTAGEIWFGETAYAAGLSCRAINAYSHAEGAGAFAYGQYAHVEGKRNTAGYASHAEGADVSAIAQYCHAEGLRTATTANYAHAEGVDVSAFGVASHAEGARTYAKGAGSHAEGSDTTASGEKSHAEGISTVASGADSHAEGNLATASGTHSHAEGSSTAASGATSHAEGYLTKSVGYAGHAEGQSTIAKGDQSHAEGAGSSAAQAFKTSGEANSKTYTTSSSHSLRVNNIIQYGKAYAKIVAVPNVSSFTVDQTLDSANALISVNINLIKGIAYNNKSHVEGQNSIATGETSHAEGGATLAAGKFSHSEGYKTEANGTYSHAAGVNAVASADSSYVWNGNSAITCVVPPVDAGTFNVNPKNGLAGFCVGGHSLIEDQLPVSSISTIVTYKSGETSAFMIEGNLLSNSIPNVKNTVDVTIGNAVSCIGVKAFYQCEQLTRVKMPDSLLSVLNTAFSKCTQLTSLSFPDNVQVIDYSGFSNCTNLRTVKLPSSMTKITDYVSYNCPKLADVVIPNGISAIGKQSFMNCSGLTHINIPKSVTTIGLSTFLNDNALKAVDFEYRELNQISSMANYSTRWGIADDNIIKPYDWNKTNGYFVTNPENGISGFYIGADNFISCVVKAFNGMTDDQKNAVKAALAIS